MHVCSNSVRSLSVNRKRINMSQTTRKAPNYTQVKCKKIISWVTYILFPTQTQLWVINCMRRLGVRFGFRDRKLNFDKQCNGNAECVGHCVPFHGGKRPEKLTLNRPFLSLFIRPNERKGTNKYTIGKAMLSSWIFVHHHLVQLHVSEQ